MNLEKIKNLTNKKSFPFIILAVVVLLLISLCFLLFVKEERIKELETQIIKLQEELTFLKALPIPDVPAGELFTPGIIGEVEPGTQPEQREEADELPAMVVNTTGVVQEILQDRIIVLGDGSNFEDRQPRQLTVLFTLETNLGLPDRTPFRGLAGLKQLQPGMQVLINSVENMRGRTEFRALNINVLEF